MTNQLRGTTAAEECVARNEALWREVNDRIDEIDKQLPALASNSLMSLHCECGRAGCKQHISLTPDEYKRLRSQSDRFAVFPGHEDETIEHVVERTDRFDIVDKLAAVEPLVGADGIPNSGN